MGFIDDLTVMILTHNEEDNIARTMDGVSWAKTILVIDSGSTDATLGIVRRYPQATVVSREFDTFANQCNFGLAQASTTWVLSLDADYVISPDLAREIRALDPDHRIQGYAAEFVYLVHGRPLRASLYPPRCVLYRRENARYRDEGHGHRVMVSGELAALRAKLGHDDRKPLSRWMSSQMGYARREADYLLSTQPEVLSLVDRLRMACWIMPLVAPAYALLWKRCVFDGPAGIYYALQRMFAETAIALQIMDRRIGRSGELNARRKTRS